MAFNIWVWERLAFPLLVGVWRSYFVKSGYLLPRNEVPLEDVPFFSRSKNVGSGF